MVCAVCFVPQFRSLSLVESGPQHLVFVPPCPLVAMGSNGNGMIPICTGQLKADKEALSLTYKQRLLHRIPLS